MTKEHQITTIIAISDSITRLGIEKAFKKSSYYNVVSTYASVALIPRVFKSDFLLFEINNETEAQSVEVLCNKHEFMKTIIFSSQRNLTINFFLTKRLILNGFIFERIDEKALVELCYEIVISKNDKTVYFPRHISAMFAFDNKLPPVLFTKIELEVLHLLNRGKFSNEIADILKLTSKTIEYHFANLKGKLKANSIVSVILYAKNMNYIPLKT